MAQTVHGTLITLPQSQARRRFTAAGEQLAREAAADPAADPWRIPMQIYEQLQREHRRPRLSTDRGPMFDLSGDPAEIEQAVEGERRRLKGGGCCGTPSSA
jgi:hypothetical protein